MANLKDLVKAVEKRGFLGSVRTVVGRVVGRVGVARVVAPLLGPVGFAAYGAYEVVKALKSRSRKSDQCSPPPATGTGTGTGSGTSSSASTTPQKKIAPYKGVYHYNAPMVRDAYFNPLPDLTVDNALYGSVNLEWYTHAKNAWTSGKAAKGAIQMDRYLWNQKTVIETLNTADKNRIKNGGKPVPRDMRGFRFLYNPENISMSWNGNTYSNNQALLMGLDNINPIAPSTSASLVSFSLFLNRIQDMTFLDKDGNYNIPNYNYTPPNLVKESLLTKLDRMDGIKRAASTPPKTFIYPQEVSQSERKSIYQRGTMYDFEWLVSTLNGFAFRDFVSEINGPTNDMGFLMQFPVELHLGNTLRYRVQVTDISIQHIIFDTRMVPTWSKVNLTCRRMPSFNIGGGKGIEQDSNNLYFGSEIKR